MRNALRALVLLCLAATVAAGCKSGLLKTNPTGDSTSGGPRPGANPVAELTEEVKNIKVRLESMDKSVESRTATAVKAELGKLPAGAKTASIPTGVATTHDVELVMGAVDKVGERIDKLESASSKPAAAPATTAAPATPSADFEKMKALFAEGSRRLAGIYLGAMRGNFQGDDEAFLALCKERWDDPAFLKWIEGCLKKPSP